MADGGSWWPEYLSRLTLRLNWPSRRTTPLRRSSTTAQPLSHRSLGLLPLARWRAGGSPNRRGENRFCSRSPRQVSAVGNFLEVVLDIPAGEALFTYGGLLSAASILLLGVILLILGGGRWAGVMLVMFVAGSAFPDDGGEFLSGAGLVLLGYWILRRESVSRPMVTR